MRLPPPDGSLDSKLAAHFGLIAGVDEVGRGALAGPLVVAAVILDPNRVPAGLDDSKRLTPRVRERLAHEIVQSAIAWAVAERSAADVDRLNVLEATREAMAEAVACLSPLPGCTVFDAVAPMGMASPTIVEARADARYLCVAAASIVAKVARDATMRSLAGEHAGYGWERNKGYGTREHLAAIERLGPSRLHRLSFAPVRVLRCNAGQAKSPWRR